MRTTTRSPRRMKSWLSVAAASALALTLAACSGGTSTPDADPAPIGNGKPETTQLLVGIVPVIDHAAVFVAIQEGYFEEEGLEVTAQPAQGTAIAAMVAGEMQAAYGTYPSFMLAQQSGLGVHIVAEGVHGTAETAGVYVAADSDIKSIKDLEGKTIAVNSLNNTGDFTIKEHLDDAGVDPATVQFIELAFPDMGPTLASGNVDAVWLVEPFRTTVEASGAKKIFATYDGSTADIPVSGVGMTADFVKKNPNTAAAFIRAIEKANALLAGDPDVARDIVSTYSSTTPELAQQLELPTWVAGNAKPDTLEIWNDIMVKRGVLQTPIDLDELVYVPGK